jgi:hypothetical protein
MRFQSENLNQNILGKLYKTCKYIRVSALNQAQFQEGTWGKRGINPRILNLGTRWRWLSNFSLQHHKPHGGFPVINCRGSWEGSRACMDA